MEDSENKEVTAFPQDTLLGLYTEAVRQNKVLTDLLADMTDKYLKLLNKIYNK